MLKFTDLKGDALFWSPLFWGVGQGWGGEEMLGMEPRALRELSTHPTTDHTSSLGWKTRDIQNLWKALKKFSREAGEGGVAQW
jgi:hypothetical protein